MIVAIGVVWWRWAPASAVLFATPIDPVALGGGCPGITPLRRAVYPPAARRGLIRPSHWQRNRFRVLF
jgi:hypothetical protein